MSSPIHPVVRLESGRVRGRRGAAGSPEVAGDVAAFLGIPYAAPAVGPDRFREARPVPRWEGERDATRHGPVALQAPYPKPLGRFLPDALDFGAEYLNVSVWTPDPGAGGLPVLVWIHGGAFVRGANSIPLYDGSAFARKGVVLVGINYRLGVTGFAALPDAPTNLGIRDQIAALTWVRDNIARFGGDPGNVTILGESAGGMSVATLCASPVARGLFARAVVQSGSGRAVASRDDAARVTAMVAERLGVEPSAKAFGGLDPAALLEAQNGVSLDLATDPGRFGETTLAGGLGIMAFFPCVDGDIVPGPPTEVIARGEGAPVPLVAGTTSEEFRLFLVPTGVAAAITQDILPGVLEARGWPRSRYELYAEHRPGATPGDIFCTMQTDAAFRAPTAELALAHRAAGHDAYVYEFAWGTAEADLGAAHALDLSFTFDTIEVPEARGMLGEAQPHELAADVHGSVVGFATTGDPGWPVYDVSDRAVMTFDLPSRLVRDPRGEELTAWNPRR